MLLSEIKNQSEELAKQSKLVQIKHSLGYHGSGKDRCNTCGRADVSEVDVCEPATTEKAEFLKKYSSKVLELYMTLSAIPIVECNKILEFVKIKWY